VGRFDVDLNKNFGTEARVRSVKFLLVDLLPLERPA
jgi:hypothetical protein